MPPIGARRTTATFRYFYGHALSCKADRAIHMTQQMRVHRTGHWLYDGTIPLPIRIISLNWDMFHEPDYDPEPPVLTADGWAYYVQWGLLPQGGVPAHRPTILSPDDSGPFAPAARLLELDRYDFPRTLSLSVEEAVSRTEELVQGPIVWDQAPDTSR